MLTFADLKALLSTSWKPEEGQTMAEYGVVLTVMPIAVVGVFTALSGGIQNAISRVTALFP